jgi:hypothetical protein
MKKLKLKSFSDGGHGWLAVKRELLIELGILEKITSYSYQKKDTVYLEEDQDVTTFVNAFQEKHSISDWKELIDLKGHTSNNRSTIRSYAHFRIEPVPVLEPGMVFSLYGHKYTAMEKIGKDWKAVNENGAIFKIKDSQLDSVHAVKGE